MRRAARVDENLSEIVEAARDCGFLVYVANSDLCDIIWSLHDTVELVEVKTAKGTFTDLQRKNRALGWRIRTVRSIEDVIKARREMA